MVTTQAPRAAPLAPGIPALGFTLRDTPDQSVSPADFRGRPVILAFYPADWSPQLADFEPKGAVSRAYRDGEEVSERALFVIDLSPGGINPGADGILRALDEMSKRRAAS